MFQAGLMQLFDRLMFPPQALAFLAHARPCRCCTGQAAGIVVRVARQIQGCGGNRIVRCPVFRVGKQSGRFLINRGLSLNTDYEPIVNRNSFAGDASLKLCKTIVLLNHLALQLNLMYKHLYTQTPEQS
jgi:hypothetical protein